MALLVDLEGVSASRPNRPLFDNISVTVSDGDRLGIVGVNGTGKSTLLRLMAGVDDPQSGLVRRGRGARVSFLDQRSTLPAGTVRSVIGDGWEAAAVLERLGMGGYADADVATLSGGQAKRVALARVLAAPGELLILDEPTNQLDMGAIAWLQSRLVDFRGGLVLVTHDRHLLDRLTTRMLELDRGHSYVHEGGYVSYLASRAEREEQAVVAESVRSNQARRELAWLRRGAPARSRKPQARIDAARRVVDGRPEAPARAGDLDLMFGTPRLGDKVIDVDAASYRYSADGPDVVDRVVLSVEPRDRLGIVGANGTGKSTLLDLLVGRKEPTAGTVERGTTVRVGYYDQLGVTLDEKARVRDLVAGSTRVPGAPEDLRLMDRFWFGGELQWATVATLSGGERRRLQLLLVLAERPNVLVLDEPTNDLDLDTLRSLEGFLDEWDGALVVVSHDRAFLERAVIRVGVLDGHGAFALLAGGVPAWVKRAMEQGVRPRDTVPRAPAGSPPRVRPPLAGGRSASTLGHLLRTTERDVGRLERRRDQLSTRMATTTDHVELARIGSDLTDAQALLDQAEERWLALAEETESARPDGGTEAQGPRRQGSSHT